MDGFDEIPELDRNRLSSALMIFSQLDNSQFHLTCRSHYPVANIHAPQYELDVFSRSDAVNFITAFGQAAGTDIDPEALCSELQAHRLQQFFEHPLMLTLTCILRSSAHCQIPRRAIGLIERALDTLTFRWDEAKGVRRISSIPLDGRERLSCLIRVAFEMLAISESQDHVISSIEHQLKLLHRRGIDSRRLLEEMARWYGVLIPAQNGQWEFVHRTIHDFLAARMWVETGSFATQRLITWDMRAAYATCLLPDGTAPMSRMLLDSDDVVAFSECLYDGAAFDLETIVTNFIRRVQRTTRFTFNEPTCAIVVNVSDNIFSSAASEFLRALVTMGSRESDGAGDAIALCALAELHARGERMKRTEVFGRLKQLLDSGRHYGVEAGTIARATPFVLSSAFL